MCACVRRRRATGWTGEGVEGCITQESRGAIRSRAFYSAVVGAGKSSHVSFTRIRNVSHKYTRNRARTHGRTRGGREIFSASLERESPSPRCKSSCSPSFLPLSSSPSCLPPLVRSNPKTAIPHLSLHLLDLQRLKRKLVRSHPDGTRTGCPCIFFFLLLLSPFIPATTSSEIKFSGISNGRVRLKLYTYPSAEPVKL